MEREIVSDCASEEFYRYLINPSVIDGAEKPKKAPNHCVVLCKKIAPNVFDIKKGIAIVENAGDYFNDGICMIAPTTKVVFVFE
ncbi:MAG: hypothetical protein A2Y03_04730 [Omnitrophica WOR_2 bacterium GWF2_38_59]|nr:MAG: hypothetical protein A2Y03_04730 [Omnitrophica WOR_2 bacterium GWF2_38_59]OGX48355.1 MAG: hypothetical protein A2243_07900 [Omnitrophica WOR_2 bacterium RIFOXYA2_FULL_38_17]OGX54744.1 MAG: hypothetical protein A2267_05990 [Omnitrophica WOR_2 bacterium RIFOXYA12_FULL_38_10]OGX55096.1 MAG: hypothetical protein A2447_02875 [Omnitrophica WOR_2 bacterium RIFOXYC2_FULL_38_12]OGX59139.1 MAG: hypothetical protein A2306_08605 [Omnitrophica WOR_2 bacterium RIFOXYB2_FULL_38_16]HBG61732.1 hypothet